MHTLRRRPLYWLLSLIVVGLVAPWARFSLTPARAQLQEVMAVVVIPVTDASGSRDPLISDKATDALAMAGEDAKSFRVIPKADLMRELRSQDLTPR